MKRKRLLMIVLCFICSLSLFLTACGDSDPKITKLSKPFVSISSTGLASWSAVANASGYTYKINDGTETNTTETSVQLTTGQSIQVKAVGDGVNYSDSDYSSVQTYGSSSTGGSSGSGGSNSSVTAPTFLGIVASSDEPTSTSVSPYYMDSMGHDLMVEATKTYFEDDTNLAGQTRPTQSSYDLYSSQNTTIYIQIWLNNPDQCTILSLKINGTKHQSGGSLKSYFYSNGKNCVYVELLTPTGVNSESYQVTEIEYVEDNNINDDGKNVFIGDDDTVTVGLAYTEYLQLGDFEQTDLSCYSVSFSAMIYDNDNVISKSGGWLRAIIYDGTNVIGQQLLTVGQNNFTFNGLTEKKTYFVMVCYYLDKLDGQGLKVTPLNFGHELTTKAIVEFVSENTNGDYATISGQDRAEINIETILYDTNKSYEKIEIYIDNDNPIYNGGSGDGTITGGDGSSSEVVTGGNGSTVVGGNRPTGTPKTPTFTYSKSQLQSMGFNGTYTFTDGILSGRNYVVRVYYTEELYEKVTVSTPAYNMFKVTRNHYLSPKSFREHLLLGFDINTIDKDIGQPYDTFETYVKNYEFRIIAYKGDTTDTYYDMTYNPNNEGDFFNSGIVYTYNNYGTTYWHHSYFVVFRNFYTESVDMNNIRWKVIIKADINDGNGIQEFDVTPDFYNLESEGMNGHIVDATADNHSISITESYDVSRGHIYKVSAYDINDNWAKDFYVNEDYSFDVSNWLNTCIDALKERGEDTEYGWVNVGAEHGGEYWYFRNPLFDFGFIEDEEYFDSLNEQAETLEFTADMSSLPVGHYSLKIFSRFNSVYYNDGEYNTNNVVTLEIALVVPGGKLPSPTITLDEKTVSWNAISNTRGYIVYVNGYEKRYVDRLETSATIDDLRDADVITVVALPEEIWSNYNIPALYENSDPSNAITFLLPKLSTPTIRLEGRYVCWDDVPNAEKYIAIIDGEEQEFNIDQGYYLEPGKTIKIKASTYNRDVHGDSLWSNSVTSQSYPGGGADGKG